MANAPQKTVRRTWPACTVLLALALALVALPARAQQDGTIVGRVFDSGTGDPIAGVSVIVIWPEPPAAASEPNATPRQDVQLSDAEGAFRFPAIPAGSYTLSFSKAGYRASNLPGLAVTAGQATRADFPLAPAAAETSEQILDLDAFAVEASTVDEGAGLLELRMDADQFLNTFSAEEFSRFAASDVAEALRRVSGVSVVEGQFAVIRGLEDRYNSTLYNGAPIPSPDPDKQSVQLDLFPSDVVSNLIVSKTFVPDLPSNSSGGAIDIVTHDYPQQFELKLSAGSGFETEALDRFLRYDKDSPVGVEADASDVIESEFGGSIGGRREFFGRDFAFKGVLNREVDYRTAEGFQESREPQRPVVRNFPRPPQVTETGDLSLGDLSLSGGRFDLTQSEKSEQDTGYFGFGFDLDEEGHHRIDTSTFYTQKREEVVQLRENGFLPGFDYSALAAIQESGGEINPDTVFGGASTPTAWIARSIRSSPDEPVTRGPLFFSSFAESQSFLRERDLQVFQINGSHDFDFLDDLHISWAANRAKTTQDETALGLQFFFEPDDTSRIPTQFPVSPDALGPGQFAANSGFFSSRNEVDEDQGFGRVDADYEIHLGERIRVELSAGGWYEKAKRDVDSSFQEGVFQNGSSQVAVFGDTPEALGRKFADETTGFLRETTTEATREIKAWSVGSKTTFWDKFDVLGGVRVEDIFIESLNDPFTGELNPGDDSPKTFPSAFLFFDRRDNPNRPIETPIAPPGTVFNDELLGLQVPIDPATGFVDLLDQASIASLVNGEIDERKVLPSFGLAYRPLEGLTLRGAYSRTVARPSFREMGFYVSVDPGSDDLIVGNPQLQLSDVESWDARAEYTWGERGDLAAVSLFYKQIDDPIESIVVRDPSNFEGSSGALFRTFFNNPNQGTLRGVEVETRKNLDFLGPDLLQYFTVGGNFTYIDAEVDRTDAELARSDVFFGVAEGDSARFPRLKTSRRLFGQPEWIANVDLSFEQPEWGTKVTLAFFAISDVLDAAGTASLNPDGFVQSFTLDRYADAFHQLDLVASQTFHVDRLRGDFTLKGSVKNLTNSARGIIFDPDQTRDEIAERSFKIGRDVSFSLSYTFSF